MSIGINTNVDWYKTLIISIEKEYFIIWDVDGTLLDTEPISRKVMQSIVDKYLKDPIEIPEYYYIILIVKYIKN